MQAVVVAHCRAVPALIALGWLLACKAPFGACQLWWTVKTEAWHAALFREHSGTELRCICHVVPHADGRLQGPCRLREAACED